MWIRTGNLCPKNGRKSFGSLGEKTRADINFLEEGIASGESHVEQKKCLRRWERVSEEFHLCVLSRIPFPGTGASYKI